MSTLTSGTPPVFSGAGLGPNGLANLYGRAAPNAIVYVYHSGGGTFYGTTTADATGLFALTTTTPLIQDANGNTPIAIAEFNSAGQQVSSWTGATVNSSAMNSTPAPAGGSNLSPGSVPIFRAAGPGPNGLANLYGRAAPNAIVYVYHSGGGTLYGTTTADASGLFSLTTTTPLIQDANGDTPIAIAEFNSSGQQISPWTGATVNSSAMNPQSAPVNPRPGGAILAPGSAPIFVGSAPAGAGGAIIKGVAAPHAIVHAYHVGGAPYYGSATADAYGNFSLATITPLVKDAAGNTPIALAEFSATGQQISGWTGATL